MKPPFRVIDEVVRAGLNRTRAECDTWNADSLPSRMRPLIMAVVDAPPPKFHEQRLPDSADSVPAEMHLRGAVLVLGVLAVLSFFLGALIAWWQESGLIFAASAGVSIATFALATWLHAIRSENKWLAFGFTPPASENELFATKSLLVMMASIALAALVAILLLVALIWLRSPLMLAIVVVLVPLLCFLLWRNIPSIRGYLLLRLRPIWFSWTYHVRGVFRRAGSRVVQELREESKPVVAAAADDLPESWLMVLLGSWKLMLILLVCGVVLLQLLPLSLIDEDAFHRLGGEVVDLPSSGSRRARGLEAIAAMITLVSLRYPWGLVAVAAACGGFVSYRVLRAANAEHLKLATSLSVCLVALAYAVMVPLGPRIAAARTAARMTANESRLAEDVRDAELVWNMNMEQGRQSFADGEYRDAASYFATVAAECYRVWQDIGELKSGESGQSHPVEDGKDWHRRWLVANIHLAVMHERLAHLSGSGQSPAASRHFNSAYELLRDTQLHLRAYTRRGNAEFDEAEALVQARMQSLPYPAHRFLLKGRNWNEIYPVDVELDQQLLNAATKLLMPNSTDAGIDG